MDLSLGRFDLWSVGSNNRNCLKVLPSAKAKKQKVVIGDDTGVATCLTVKKGQGDLVFKSKPTQREVTALVLGGTRELKDKIYMASGQTIQGLKKKGAEFFRFNTSLNEDIMNMFVEDLVIWTTCEYILNMFENYKDTHFFMANDKINHFSPMMLGGETYHSVLACQDRFVRVLQNSDLYYEQTVEGPVNCVMPYTGVPPSAEDGEDTFGGTNLSEYKQLLYGTDSGTVGQLLLDKSTVRKGWLVENESKRAGISVMHSVDLTHDGVPDIVVGREDGSLEVYGFEDCAEPTEIFLREINESITGIDDGFILGVKEPDVCVSTYAGKIVCFTSEVKSNVAHVRPKGAKEDKKALMKKFGSNKPQADVPPPQKQEENQEYNTAATEQNIAAMREELDRLHEKLDKEKEKYSKLSSNMVAVEKQFKVKKSFKLLADEACYLLSVEIAMPLDVVTIQSDVPVMLLDVVTNNAMVSHTAPKEGSDSKLLAAYRCQDATNRIEIKIRTVEGQHGNLKVYVIPKLTPKTCQMTEIHIKPLSLHAKVHNADIEEELKTRPINTLTLSGDFSLSEVHSWVGSCLPSVTPRLNTEEASVAFKSTFLDTVLLCDYTRGRGVFKSDSISVISIIKEVITKEATQKKTQINIQLDIQDDSITSYLQLLKPLLDHHFSLAKRHSLIAPLSEIQTHEGDVSFLSEEYQDILKNATEIKTEFKIAPMHLDFLRNIVTELYVDKFKLKGKHRVQNKDKLQRVLDNYDFEKLLDTFKN